MLSSRDTPMDEDGWSLVIEDLRRLSLLVGGGANDMNAGAIDADQQALNDLASGLDAHKIDPDAHAELFAAVAATSAAHSATGFSAWAYQEVPPAALAYATLTAYQSSYLVNIGSSFASGVFTAPSTGYYGYSVSGEVDVQASVIGSQALYGCYLIKNGSPYAPGFSAYIYCPDATNQFAGTVALSGIVQMTAGDTIAYQHAYTVNAGAISFIAYTGRFTANLIGA